MPELLQHRHCVFCGKAVHVDDTYCSKECESRHEAIKRQQKKRLTLFYIAMVILLLGALMMARI